MKNKTSATIVVVLSVICVCFMLFSNFKLGDTNNPEGLNKLKQNQSNDSDFKSSTSDNKKKNKLNDNCFEILRSDIIGKITPLDRENLLNMGTKLSAIDYTAINQYLDCEDYEGIAKTIELLKLRLSDKEFEKVEEISAAFIDYKLVEERARK